MAEEDATGKAYEEARKQRLLDNQKRFEDLGILKISKSLSDLKKSEKKPLQHHVKRKAPTDYVLEPRRSSRARNVVSYCEDVVDIHLPSLRKRSKMDSSWASYIARPLDEVKTASYEERINAVRCAEKLQSNLQSDKPYFIKSMVRSHVYSCFWLGLPSKFCEDYLPKSTVNIVLENEKGDEYDAVFISKRTGLSGGWRAFALDHKLDDGDALVFELTETTRFKVYTVRASECSAAVEDDVAVTDHDGDAEKASKGSTKLSKEGETQPKRAVKSKKNVNFSRASTRKLRRR